MGRNHMSGINIKLPVSIQPNIGLDGEARESAIEILNINLADESILTMKTHSALWLVQGPGFLELRTLFNQQFQNLNNISDEIAERVRVLGGAGISSFEEFLKHTRLEERPGSALDIMGLLADHEATVRFLREDARKCLEEFEDHGSYVMFVHFIALHEKMAWELRSYIEPEIRTEELKTI